MDQKAGPDRTNKVRVSSCSDIVPSEREIAAAQAFLERTVIDEVVDLRVLMDLEAAVNITRKRPIPPQQRYIDEWSMVLEKHRFAEDCLIAIRARRGQLTPMNSQSKIAAD